jgi:hypothetical protein
MPFQNTDMTTEHFSASIGRISVSATDIDSDLAQKAERHLPAALEKAGEAAAKKAWEKVQNSFRSSGFSVSSSSGDRDKFICEATREFVRDANSEDRRILKDQIVEQLLKERNQKKLSTAP